MKKTILITSGIFILLIVLLVWVYLMLFGTPKDGGEVFANLGFEPNVQDTTISDPFIPSEGIPIEDLVDTSSAEQLRQLTTRPIAGFVSTTTGSSTVVRYVEQGTGHIYEIDLDTGVETQVSRTTVARVREAVFADSGSVVALLSFNNNLSSVVVGTIEEAGSLTTIELQPGARDIEFTSDTHLRYTVPTNGTTIGYEHNLPAQTRTELFRFNYTSLDTHWRNGVEQPLIITKPAADLPGYMYEIIGSTVTPYAPSAYGLTGFVNSQWLLVHFTANNNYQFIARRLANDTNLEMPIAVLEEKCAFDSLNSNYLWCAAPASLNNGDIENWYKGVTRFSDYLWLLDIEGATAELIASPERLSGRTLDVKKMHINKEGTDLFFVNKDDNTLWQFDLLAE